MQTETDLPALGEDTERESIACLYRCVLLQALADASATPAASDTKKIIDRARSREWLLNDGEDFAFVCECAGEDPTELRGHIVRIAWAGWKKNLCDPATIMREKKKSKRRKPKTAAFV